MFGFFRRKTQSDCSDALVRQTIGGQSVLYRIFLQTLGVEDVSVRKLELTYFATTVTTFVYLRIGKDTSKEETLDKFSMKILKASIPSSGEQIALGDVVRQYKARFAEYSALISPIFSAGDRPSPEITLTLHLFECVTGQRAQGHMLKIAAASGLISQYIIDHIDFVDKKM